MTGELLNVLLELLRIDGGTQPRASLDETVVAEYAEALKAGGKLPPVIVYFDGSEWWLADGFHRYHAHRAAGATEISAEVREGTRRDAVLFSAGANASHGLRRTNDDKRRAVMTLLNDAEWMRWSDNAIAKACSVSNHMVASLRSAILDNSKIATPDKAVSRIAAELSPSCDRSQDGVRTVERNGKTYEQNTANIGKAKKVAEANPTAFYVPKPVAASTNKASAALTPSASQSDAPADYGPSDEEIAEAVRVEAEQMEYIKTLLANDDDPLTKALADVKQLRALNAALKSQNDGYQHTINEQIRTINSLRAQVKKLERAA
jgi:hypothetical protein